MVERQKRRVVGGVVTVASATVIVAVLSAASFSGTGSVGDAVRLRPPAAGAGTTSPDSTTASTTASTADSGRSTTTTTAAPTTTVAPTTTTRPLPLTVAALPAAPPPAGDPYAMAHLGWGDSGDLVTTLQNRLDQLGFRTGDEAGYFGSGTWSAVLALQKFEGLDRTGNVDALTWAHLFTPIGVMPPQRPAAGIQVEVDLERQVVIVLNAEQPLQVTILNTSTGGNYAYTNKDGSSDFAYTPGGIYNGYRRVDGVDEAPLGTLYRPIYFYLGWALHGSPSVPAYPASHGCVRLSNDDMDWLWDRAPDDLSVTVRESMNPAAATAEAAQWAADAAAVEAEEKAAAAAEARAAALEEFVTAINTTRAANGLPPFEG